MLKIHGAEETNSKIRDKTDGIIMSTDNYKILIYEYMAVSLQRDAIGDFREFVSHVRLRFYKRFVHSKNLIYLILSYLILSIVSHFLLRWLAGIYPVWTE